MSDEPPIRHVPHPIESAGGPIRHVPHPIELEQAAREQRCPHCGAELQRCSRCDKPTAQNALTIVAIRSHAIGLCPGCVAEFDTFVQRRA
jgi:uncharacterized protein with PIN domain